MYWILPGIAVAVVTYAWMRVKLDHRNQDNVRLASDLAYQWQVVDQHKAYAENLRNERASLKNKLEVAEDDIKAAQDGYNDIHASFVKFRTDAEAMCRAAHEERDSLKRELALYAKPMADADDVWYQGPPPYIGWWNASTNRDKTSWRWWSGTWWSLATPDTEDDEYAAIQAENPASFWELTPMEWRHYYPANARVPRMNPEQWEKS